MATCIRCGRAPASELADFCLHCAAKTQRELTGGLRRLERYLGAWAAFEAWSGDSEDEGPSRDSPDDRERDRSPE